MNIQHLDDGLFGITDGKGKIELLKEEFKKLPDKYPEIYGQKYWHG